jgi:FkbM family methyltransferase
MVNWIYKLGLQRKHLAHPIFKYPLRALVRMGLMPAKKLWGIPIHEVFKLTVSPRTFVLYSVTPDDGLGLDLYWQGLQCFEEELVPVFLEAVRTASGVLDLGAHRGIYGLLACAVNPRVEVICVEPVPGLCDVARANLEMNGFASRSTVARCAVSDQMGRAVFYLPSDQTMGSLEESVYPHLQRAALEVDVTTVDALVPPGMRVDVVKIDVEGSEDKVLNGMRRLISECRPTIFFECIPQGPYSAVQAILDEFGYRFYHLGPGRAVPVTNLIPPREGKLYNFMATIDNQSCQQMGAMLSSAHPL